MSMLTREAILAADDLKREEVQVPEWGGAVCVTTMTGAGRDAWEQSLVGAKGAVNITNVRARLVAYTVVDAEGQRLFTDADAEALGRKSAAALDRCAKVAQRLNGLNDTALEDARGN